MACQLDPPLSLEPLITCSSLNQINSNALQHLIATFYAIQDTNAVPKDLFLFDVDAETDKFNNDDSRFVNHKFSKWLDSQQDDEEQDQGDDEIRITSQIETFICPLSVY